MSDFCSSNIPIDESDAYLLGWRCTVFITFIITHSLLVILAIWLYTYHRWQANLQKRLLIQDYQHHRNSSKGRNISSSNCGNKDESLKMEEALLGGATANDNNKGDQ
jgi:hypothetical protein